MQNPCRRGKEAFFPHPEDETKFIQCSNFGQMFEFACAPGLIWNQPSASCIKGQVTSIKPIKQALETFKSIDKTIVTTPPSPPPLATTTQNPFTITSPMNVLGQNFGITSAATDVSIASSAIFDNEICTNLEIKNNNSPFINGIYTKSDAKIFRRSDNPQISGFIGVVHGRWWVIYFP